MPIWFWHRLLNNHSQGLRPKGISENLFLHLVGGKGYQNTHHCAHLIRSVGNVCVCVCNVKCEIGTVERVCVCNVKCEIGTVEVPWPPPPHSLTPHEPTLSNKVCWERVCVCVSMCVCVCVCVCNVKCEIGTVEVPWPPPPHSLTPHEPTLSIPSVKHTES